MEIQKLKQTVYLPVKEGTSDMSVSYWEKDVHIADVKEIEAFVFTPEQLNEYTAKVIKQALDTAAESAEPNILNKRPKYAKFTIVDVDKQSITNTFEETFKKFEA